MRGQSVTLAKAVMVTVTAIAAATAAMAGPVTEGAAPPPLDSLYIVRAFFSDNIPDSFEEVIDVTPVGEDVRLRVIRISRANFYCENRLVRAAETVVPRRSIKDVLSVDPCTLQQGGIERALNNAKPGGTPELWHDSTYVMVARCGGRERVFKFPYSIHVDDKKLQRWHPRVAALRDVAYRVPGQVFPSGSWMNDPNPDVQRALEALGDKVVPELISEKYATAFASGYLAGYKGAPPVDKRGLLPPALRDAEKYRFVKYVAPERSQIILAARIAGEVHLRVHADPATGLVTNVEIVKGLPLLRDDAARAARQWQFEPGSITTEAVDVWLNFSLDCYP